MGAMRAGELPVEAGLADAGLADHRDDLTVPGLSPLPGLVELIHLAVAADEAGQPTGGGGVIPGYSDQRQIELLAEGGLTPLEAIKVGTMNGATYLGRADRVGSIATGKQADLVVIDGDPSAQIADIRKVTLVFKQGVAYDPAKLIASVKGRVGLF